eukprot:3455645-Prorocentrum_lima.AAC.1
MSWIIGMSACMVHVTPIDLHTGTGGSSFPNGPRMKISTSASGVWLVRDRSEPSRREVQHAALAL